MIEQLVSQFMGSRQGQTAFARLQAQGYNPAQAQQMIQTALPTAAQSFHGVNGGTNARPGGPQGILDIGNSNYGTNFISGAVAGLLRGQGLKNSAIDGLQGVVGGHVAQVIGSRFGLPQRVSGTIGAILTPLMIDWLWEKVNGGGLSLGSLFGGGAQQGMQQGMGALPPPSGSGYGQAPGGGWGGGMQSPPPMGGGGWGGGSGMGSGMGMGPGMGPGMGSAQSAPPGTVPGGVQGALGQLFGFINRNNNG